MFLSKQVLKKKSCYKNAYGLPNLNCWAFRLMRLPGFLQQHSELTFNHDEIDFCFDYVGIQFTCLPLSSSLTLLDSFQGRKREWKRHHPPSIQFDNVAAKVHMYGLTTSLCLQRSCHLLKVNLLLHNELGRCWVLQSLVGFKGKSSIFYTLPPLQDQDL